MTRSPIRKPQAGDPDAGASDAPRREGPPQPYPGHKARQGRIVLNTTTRRAIFLAGLAGTVILVLVLATLTG